MRDEDQQSVARAAGGRLRQALNVGADKGTAAPSPGASETRKDVIDKLVQEHAQSAVAKERDADFARLREQVDEAHADKVSLYNELISKSSARRTQILEEAESARSERERGLSRALASDARKELGAAAKVFRMSTREGAGAFGEALSRLDRRAAIELGAPVGGHQIIAAVAAAIGPEYLARVGEKDFFFGRGGGNLDLPVTEEIRAAAASGSLSALERALRLLEDGLERDVRRPDPERTEVMLSHATNRLAVLALQAFDTDRARAVSEAAVVAVEAAREARGGAPVAMVGPAAGR